MIINFNEKKQKKDFKIVCIINKISIFVMFKA